ncbi:hypothetical protein DFO73_12054 [Cytobacillus oceanisediminis]|jgi:hypothetical protein|uniref:Uncharacterized protein n=1 Tax=Cytobacillus oceanisediminis TaxID=665099 RepID=A0A2V2ZIK4_9BACI|nr:hypothetical protein DFO73_12054 [Cytobacillus oceanisediminis]
MMKGLVLKQLIVKTGVMINQFIDVVTYLSCSTKDISKYI